MEPVLVTLRDRPGVPREFEVKQQDRGCSSQQLPEDARIFKTKKAIRIADGSLTNRSRGPKIGKRYEIEVLLEDGEGNRQTAIGRPRGLCDVITE
jgi:hypothetical protein